MIKQTSELMELGSDPLRYIIEMIFQEHENAIHETTFTKLKEVKFHLRRSKVILEKEGLYEASRIDLKESTLMNALSRGRFHGL